MRITEDVPFAGKWDIIVVGGGVAGVAAAVSAARAGKKTLITEKTLTFGGLATNGLINYFVPMCNGRGKQIIYGMADEMLKMSWKVGWTTTKECWRNDYPQKNGRLDGRYSPAMFALALSDMLQKAGADIYLDTLLSGVVTNGGHVEGIITDSKSGRQYLTADYFVDATGDSDLMYRAGMPTVNGGNYFTYSAMGMNLETMERAVKSGDIGSAYISYMGGKANLYGGNQPQGKKLYTGVTKEEVTEYVLDNQKLLMQNIGRLKPGTFDITMLPAVPQLRTTRRLDGDATFSEKDAYVHFDDSVCAINDFDRNDYLYEVRYGCLVKSGFDNVITAGKSASASGYGWDVLRVIPPAILTGQAAGNACSIALDVGAPIYGIDVEKLQEKLSGQNVDIHFDDALVPADKSGEKSHYDNGHI